MGFTGIVGHEFVGVVERVEPYAEDQADEESRSSAAMLVGKRVVGEINLGGWGKKATVSLGLARSRSRTCQTTQFSLRTSLAPLQLPVEEAPREETSGSD